MRQFIVNLTEDEKRNLQWLAETLGLSMEEVLTQSIMKALEQNRTGVYDATE